jgi:aryl-alcohol dehydrogenase-like predicted oxidoreductase
MKRSKLGKSDIVVSAMTLGCWPFGEGEYWGAHSQNEVDKVVQSALDNGVNAFDTAEVYNEGNSERSLGKALKGRRDEAVVMSKISPSNAGNVRKHCIASLQRLNMDYLDVYMLHWPINKLALEHFTSDKSVIEKPPVVEEAFHQLNELKKEGLIRSIGLSNFGRKQMEEVEACGVQVDVNEITYNIVSRAIEAEIVPYCQEKQISIIGSMGLQQGLLGGKYKTADDVPKHQAHSRHFQNFRGGDTSRHGEEGAEKEIFEVLNELYKIAARLNLDVAQLSIAWILKKPFMASTLVGSRNVDHLKMNIKACSLTIPDDVEALIDKISLPVLEKLGNNPDYYEHSSKSRIR